MSGENTQILRHLLALNEIEYDVDLAKQSLTGMVSNDILPIVAYPDTMQKFKSLMSYVANNGVAYEVVGALTNTYLADGFCRDIVVKTTKLKGISQKENGAIIAECGCNLTKISRDLSDHGITGYEGLVGIPGTVGGAVVNNSGGFDSSMDKVVKRVLVLENGVERWFDKNEMGFENRSSILKKGKRHAVVLAAELDVSHKRAQGEIDVDLEKYAKFRKKWIDGRRKSLGSVFCAQSFSELVKRHKVRFAVKRFLSVFLRIFIKNPRLNVWLDFFFFGNAKMAKHCDSLNRFCWDEDTTEQDFMRYMEFMQDRAGGRLKLEIEIKK